VVGLTLRVVAVDEGAVWSFEVFGDGDVHDGGPLSVGNRIGVNYTGSDFGGNNSRLESKNI
jgi:hypothetical protein